MINFYATNFNVEKTSQNALRINKKSIQYAVKIIYEVKNRIFMIIRFFISLSVSYTFVSVI